MSEFIVVVQGSSPLVLGLPHTGVKVPSDVWDGLNDTGRALADTDWHIHQLYDGLLDGVSSVRTTMHRYVIDVNRDPAGESLYPGQNTTGLCPISDFDGLPIYRAGCAPDVIETARRLADYHAPYHKALSAELARVRDIHGFALLYDCHSIRGDIPFLFDGRLPDFNVGTNLGATCDPTIEQLVFQICEQAAGYSSILNGRFKGGWTTRYYGKPAEGFHSIQMELAQSCYLAAETPPWDYDPVKAARLRNVLGDILQQLTQWRP